MNLITESWPWYVAGPIIGLFVPLMVLIGGKQLGVSSSFRHICAVAFPKSKNPYLKYSVKENYWNLFFVFGIGLGGYITNHWMNAKRLVIFPQSYDNYDEWWKLLVGGVLIGFGTRYAKGCTSGHAINGLSHLQLASLMAVFGFFAGGLFARAFF